MGGPKTISTSGCYKPWFLDLPLSNGNVGSFCLCGLRAPKIKGWSVDLDSSKGRRLV